MRQTYSWIQAWVDTKQAQGLSQATIDIYIAAVERLGLDLEHCSLDEIRARLAEIACHYSHGSLHLTTRILKIALTNLGRKTVADTLRMPKPPNPRVVIYEASDVEKMLNICDTLRDRLLIKILYEAGPRRGELCNMRIKDVQFDEYSAIIWLHGKTGTRTRRIYDAREEIREYLSQHPHRDNPEAKFWVGFNPKGGSISKYRSLSGYRMYAIVHEIGRRALNRGIFPHGFRHAAATRDAKNFTDREMMLRYGWTNPATVGVYAHLSARDVDEKDLMLHGCHAECHPCPNCHSSNMDGAKFCQECGKPLLHRSRTLATERQRCHRSIQNRPHEGQQ
jgi:integrase